MARHPDAILSDLAVMCEGRVGDHMALVWEILDDVRSSYRLAMTNVVDPERLDEIQDEVLDYLVNHYGDD